MHDLGRVCFFRERIHILAPVPGKSSVGVEVPNAIKTKVIMRDLLESEEWRNTKIRIPLALGKDVYGHPIIADLAETAKREDLKAAAVGQHRPLPAHQRVQTAQALDRRHARLQR